MPLYQIRMRDATGEIRVRHEEAADETTARIRARDHFGHGEITSAKEVEPKQEKKQEAPKKQPEFKATGEGPNGRAE